MQVSYNQNDSLVKEISSPYSTIFSILRQNNDNINNLYLLGECLEAYLKKKVKKELMSCVGANLDTKLVALISDYYNKFDVDIPIINSIMIIHGYNTIYYKEALELSLDDTHFQKTKEVIELRRSIFDQFPNLTEINLHIYIKILGIKSSVRVSIFDFNENKYIHKTLGELLSKTITRDPNIVWESGNSARII